MAADFASAFSVGSAANELVWDLALDGAGNTCVVGRFSGTVDFDPGPGTYELSTPAGTGNTFAARYDPNGNLLWAQQMGGNASNFGPEIAAGADGSVYVVGSFTGSADFGATTLTSLGGDDAFVTKLDADGNFVWANRVGGLNPDWGNDVKVDGSGNVYAMAETRSSVTASPDATITKFDASGNLLWTYTVGASSSTTTRGKNTVTSGWARGFKLAVDAAGAIYATGRMSGTVDFDAAAGTSALSGAGFVMKLTSDGNLAWAKTFVGATVSPQDIAVDTNGNVYSTGLYYGSVDFDPGSAKSQKFILDSGVDGGGGFYPSYVSALTSSGGFLWAKSTHGTTSTEAIALDGQGGLYLAGEFSGTADFDPGPGAFNLVSTGDVDAFIWKLDTSGNLVWVGQMGGASADRARGIGVDAVGSIYVAGGFSGTADFDPGASTFNLTSSSGGGDFFVVKHTQTSLLALAASAAGSQTSSLLLATEPSRRPIHAATVDSALALFAENERTTGRHKTLNEELLLTLVGA